jgi:hypothetical protein
MSALLRRGWVPAVLVLWTAGWFNYRWGHGGGDWFFFRAAARSVLADGVAPLPGGPLHLYAEMPELQFGPPVVALMLPTLAVSPDTARLLGALVMVVIGLLCLWALFSTAKQMGRQPRSSTMLLTGLLVIPPWVGMSVTYMHVDDVVALGCVCLAVRLIVGGNGLAAGLVLGIGGASKPWAVVFWPLVMVLPRAARAPAALMCVLVAAANWAPFLLADPTTGGEISHIHSYVHDDSTLHLLRIPLVAGHWTPGWLRPLQFALGIVVAAAVIRRGRWTAAPLAAVTSRLVTDGSTYLYYGAGAVVLAAMWDLLEGRRLPIATAGALVVEYLCPSVLPDTATAVIRLAVGVLLVGALLRPGHEEQAAPEPTPTASAVPAT